MTPRIVTLALALALALLPLPVRAADPASSVQKLTHPRFSYPTWSPDGTRILYESNISGNWEIYVMGPKGIEDNGGDVTRLTDNNALDRMPSWSRDGRYIAFISDRDGDFEVFRMLPDGSEQTQLTHDDLPEIHPYWTPDSKRIVYNRRVKDKRLYSIWTMNPDGTHPEEILRDEELNSYAQMSPDGKLIAFDKWQDNNEHNGEIYVMEVESRKLRRLTRNDDVYDGYPTWTPDGERIIYASEVGENFKLFSIRPDGTGRTQLTFGPGSDARANVSPDGERIVFNRDIDDNINIVVIPIEGETPAAPAVSRGAAAMKDVHPQIRPVFEGVDAYPRPSPDGRSLAFVSNRDGNLEIYRMDLATGGVRRLTDNEASDNMPVFSPDGRKILFLSDRSGHYDMWEMNADGSNPVNVSDNPANNLRGRYSADGEYMVFDSDRDAGPMGPGGMKNLEIYVMRLDTRKVERVTRWPHWDLYGSFSPDGTQVAFCRSYPTGDPNRPHGDVWVHDLATGKETKLTDGLSYVGYTQWSPAGDWIVFASDVNGLVDRSGTEMYDFDIYAVRSDGSDLTRITHGGGVPESYTRPSFSPDGKKIYANRVLGKREDLVVIDFTQ